VLHSEWSVLGELTFSTVLMFGTRAFGLWMVAKVDRAAREEEDVAVVDYLG